MILARSALVLCFADVFAYGEEFEKAAAARLLAARTGLSWRELPYHPYEGGGFVQSLLDAFAFACLGPSVLALKATTLLWNLAILWAGFRLLERHFGRTGARLFGLFLIAAPASFQKLSVLALGIHTEATLFLLLSLGAGLDLARSERPSPWRWAPLGALGGFACYFSYQSSLAVAAVAAGLWWARGWPPWRALIALGGGFAAGLAPWLSMWARWGGQLFDVHGEGLAPSAGGLAAAGATLESVFAGRSALDRGALLLACAALPLLALSLGGRGLRSPSARRAGAWILGYSALFLAAYLLSGFAVGAVHHYVWLARLAPLWMASTLALSAVLGTWLEGPARGPRALALAATALWLCAGAAGTVRECAAGSPDTPLRNLRQLAAERGYAWDGYLLKLWPRMSLEPEEKLRLLRRLEDGDGALLEEALALAWTRAGPHDLAQLERDLGPRPAEFAAGLGLWLQQRGQRSLEGRLIEARRSPESLRAGLVEAVGRFGMGPLASLANLEQELRRGMELDAPMEFFVGLGWRAYRGVAAAEGPYWRTQRRRLRFAPRELERFLSAAPEGLRPWLALGLERARRAHALPGAPQPRAGAEPAAGLTNPPAREGPAPPQGPPR